MRNNHKTSTRGMMSMSPIDMIYLLLRRLTEVQACLHSDMKLIGIFPNNALSRALSGRRRCRRVPNSRRSAPSNNSCDNDGISPLIGSSSLKSITLSLRWAQRTTLIQINCVRRRTCTLPIRSHWVPAVFPSRRIRAPIDLRPINGTRP